MTVIQSNPGEINSEQVMNFKLRQTWKTETRIVCISRSYQLRIPPYSGLAKN